MGRTTRSGAVSKKIGKSKKEKILVTKATGTSTRKTPAKDKSHMSSCLRR